jgi:hypothetical protein
LQLEISHTQVFDRPLHGRQFFEEVIKDHIDLGRPDQIQVIFGKRRRPRPQRAPRTRIFTEDVNPSLQVGFKNTRVKQYFKLGRALRTETTFNDTYDVGIGRKLENLPKLIQLGRDINRRLLELELQSHRPSAAASHFESVVLPTGESGRRASGLRFGDPRVMALFAALSQFSWVFGGFHARQLRPVVEAHLGSDYSMGQMAYDLRRLLRKGLIARLSHSHRYELTTRGGQVALFLTKLHSRAICAGLAQHSTEAVPNQLGVAWRTYDAAVGAHLEAARVAA